MAKLPILKIIEEGVSRPGIFTINKTIKNEQPTVVIDSVAFQKDWAWYMNMKQARRLRDWLSKAIQEKN